jgi:hypothetical protein
MMDNHSETVIRLLTEIRDAQREESAYRKRVMDESLRLQRSAVVTQRVALGVVGALVMLGVLAAIGLQFVPNR